MQFEKYAGTFVTIGVLGIGWAVSFGQYKAKFSNHEDRLAKIESAGSAVTRETLIQQSTRLDALEKRQAIIDNRQDEVGNRLNEIYTSVKIIEAWIKQQNGRSINATH